MVISLKKYLLYLVLIVIFAIMATATFLWFKEPPTTVLPADSLFVLDTLKGAG